MKKFKIDKEILKDIIIPLVVGISSVIVAINANRIYEIQTLIAKNAEAPTIHVQVNSYESKGEIEIYFLDGKYENPEVRYISFFHVEAFDYSNGERVDVSEFEFPMHYYDSYGIENDKYGLIEFMSCEKFYTLYNDYMEEFELYYDKREIHHLAVDIQTYLKIDYQNLLGEQEEVYYRVMVPIDRATRIDNDLGEKEFEKYEKMVALNEVMSITYDEKICPNVEDFYQRFKESD